MDALLKKLIHSYGISGREEDIRNIIRNEIRKYVDEIAVDSLGNLIARKKGKKPKVMLAAHMDEIGLVAKHIEENGHMHFSFVGGIEPLTLLGEMVKIRGRRNESIRGVITTDLMSDGEILKKVPDIDEMYVDTGMSKKDLMKEGIGVGTFLALKQDEGYLGSEDVIYGKALDDRLGCYILLQLAKKLRNSKNEIYYVFTVEEEIGFYGAITSAYKIEPDWAIAVDVTGSFQKDDAKVMGNGPTIIVKDASMIGNQYIDEWLVDTARKKKIPSQLDVSDIGTTDALAISVSKGGVPTASVGVVVKNIHTTVGIASMKDINNAIKLLYELLKEPHNVKLK